MLKCCATPPLIAQPSFPIEKQVATCGTWFRVSGWGVQRVYFYLGEVQSDVTVWFRSKYKDDTVAAFQFDEALGVSPENTDEGSFTFAYAPYDTKEGNDEIVLEFTNKHADSEWEIRMDCPEPYVFEDGVTFEPKETESVCGRYHKQSGPAKQNTIKLGESAGTVDVIWKIDGYAEVHFYQGENATEPFQVIKSNRNGEFSFYYDPENGPVYAITHGQGSVEYLFNCPYNAEVVGGGFKFECESDVMHSIDGANTVEFEMPEGSKGAIDIDLNIVETLKVTIFHGDNAVQVIEGYEGSLSFSIDYDYEIGKLWFAAEGYGIWSVGVSCPLNSTDPGEEEPGDGDDEDDYPKHTDYFCTSLGDQFQTFEAPLILEPERIETEGDINIRYVTATGDKTIIIRQNGEEIFRDVVTDQMKLFTFPYVPDYGDLQFVISGQGEFELDFACPMQEYETPTFDITCNEYYEIPQPSYVNVVIPEDEIASWVQIVVPTLGVLYKNDELVAIAQDDFYYHTPGDKWKFHLRGSGKSYPSFSCPKENGLTCGGEYLGFIGDTYNVNSRGFIGETTFTVEPNEEDDELQVVWYFNGELYASTEGVASVKFNYAAEDDHVKLVTIGKGTVKIGLPCPFTPEPKPEDEVCGDFIHEGEGPYERRVSLESVGIVNLLVEVGVNTTFSIVDSENEELFNVVGPTKEAVTFYTEDTYFDFKVEGEGRFRFTLSCPLEDAQDANDEFEKIEDEFIPIEDDGSLYCEDRYGVEITKMADLTLPVLSSGTECEKNLTGRAHVHSNSVSKELFGARLVTMVRSTTTNSFVPTDSGDSFEFWYEFPVKLEPDEYTFMLRAAERDCDVALYVNCWPVLDRARNMLLKSDVYLFDEQSLVQISWRYRDNITRQTQYLGGIYAAIIRKSDNRIVWRSGDDMVNMRHNAPLMCEDSPVFIATSEDMEERIPCGEGETRDGVVGGLPYIVAKWKRNVWSDGTIEETEKEVEGFCALPPYIVSSEVLEIKQNCPSGQTKNGEEGGPTYITGRFTRYTWSDDTTTDDDIVWDGVCTIPVPLELVSTEIKTIITQCDDGYTKGGFEEADPFITGTYREFKWSDGSVTTGPIAYAEGEVCELAVMPGKGPEIVETRKLMTTLECPSGQTSTGYSDGDTFITGSYDEYVWNNGKVTRSPTDWGGASCSIIRLRPEEKDPAGAELDKEADSGTSTTPNGRFKGAGTTTEAYDCSLSKLDLRVGQGSNTLGFSEAAKYADSKLNDIYGAKRIIFSNDPEVPNKNRYIEILVPISMAISVEQQNVCDDDGYVVDLTLSNVEIREEPYRWTYATKIDTYLEQSGKNLCSRKRIVQNGTYFINRYTGGNWSAALGTSQSRYNEMNARRKRFFFKVIGSNWFNYRYTGVETTKIKNSSCYTDRVKSTYDVKSDYMLFSIDTKNAQSGLSGVSFAIVDRITGAVLYRSGQDNNIRIRYTK